MIKTKEITLGCEFQFYILHIDRDSNKGIGVHFLKKFQLQMP